MSDDVHIVRVTQTPAPSAEPVRINVAPGSPPVVEGLAGLRKLAGLTQAQVGARLGVSQAAVQKLERQPDPRLSTVRKYAEALDGGGFEVRVALARHGWMTLRLPDGAP